MANIFDRPLSGRAALNQQRAVVAELFTSALSAVTDFRDARVCRHFLAGLCTADVFFRLKLSPAACERVHDEALVAAYDAARRAALHPGFEGELARHLEELVTRNDREGFAAANAAAAAAGSVPRVNADTHPDVADAARAVVAKQAELDAAGAATAVQLEDVLLSVKRRKCEALARVMRAADSSGTKARLCATCGTVLMLVDNDERAYKRARTYARARRSSALTLALHRPRPPLTDLRRPRGSLSGARARVDGRNSRSVPRARARGRGRAGGVGARGRGRRDAHSSSVGRRQRPRR
jgi:hypothetical protein